MAPFPNTAGQYGTHLLTVALPTVAGLATLPSAACAAAVTADLARGAGPALAARYESLIVRPY